MLSAKRLAACRRNIRIAHSMPATAKQKAAARRNVKFATEAAAAKPRTAKQLAASSRNILKAHSKLPTRKQIQAVCRNLQLATRAAMLLPKTEKQRASSRRTIGFAHPALARAIRRKNGNCEICEEKCFMYKDHDHRTGKFRGRLCRRCNLGIGIFKDSTEILAKAIDYLKKYEVQRFPRLSKVA